MSYSQWSASLNIPHIHQAHQKAAEAGTVPPADAALRIEYECSCGRLHPHLAYLFWCKHCAALQCQQCTQQQVDTYFCPACLNSVFTTPAFANQNRCEQCVECPSCFHILSPMHRPSGLFAYVCEFCQWCSEEYTPPGSSGALKSPLTAAESNLLAARVKEQEQTTGHQAEFAACLAHFKARTTGASKQVTGATSSTAASVQAARKQQLFDQFESLLAQSQAANPLIGGGTPGGHERRLSRVASLSSPSKSSAAGFVDSESSNVQRWMSWREGHEKRLREFHYTLPQEPVQNTFEKIPQEFLGYFDGEDGVHKAIEEMSSLPQRLSHPSSQQLWTSNLLPRRKALSTKLAHRCRTCNKFLVKPGPGASKPNMEIHLAAVSHIPTITLGQFRPLRVGRPTSIIVYFKNKVEKGVKLWLSMAGETEVRKGGKEKEEGKQDGASTTVTPSSSYPPATASVEWIHSPVSIAAYDDIPEENANWQDDHGKEVEPEPMLVVFRQLSKVGLLMHVTPTTHEQSTHFVLLVHMQASENAPAPAAADAAATTPAPAEVITFPVHFNLGFAQA